MVPLFLILVAVAAAVLTWKVLSKKLLGKIDTWKQEASVRGYELDLTHRSPPPLQFDLLDAVGDSTFWTTVTHPDSGDSAHLYKFEVRTGGAKEKFRRSCALVELPFSAPKTTLRPRSMQTAPPRLTDGDDHVLGVGRFDEMFRLQGADESFSQALFGSEFGAWLSTADGKAGQVEFEFRDSKMFCVGPKAGSIDELLDFLEWAQIVSRRATAALDQHPAD